MKLRLRRSTLVATGLSLIVSALTVLFAAPAYPEALSPSALSACGSPASAPCVVSVQVGGADMAAPYGYVGTYTAGSSKDVSFTAEKNGSDDLGAGELGTYWRVVIFMGNWAVPRVTSGKGQKVTVTRTHDSSGYTVTVTGEPVTVSGQCDGSGYCPEEWVATSPSFNNKEWAATFDLQITDYGSWSDATQRDSFYGMNYFTNIAYTELPPQITYPSDPSLPPYLLINAANRRYRQDGTTLVQGHSELRIPNSFLRVVYGVPNPADMTSSGIVVGGDGTATVSITQESGGGAMLVLIDRMHFPNVSGPAPASTAFAPSTGTATSTQSSIRHLRYRLGTITPTRPRNVTSKRTTRHRARVSFGPSRSRGAHVRGYLVRCRIYSGKSFVRATGPGSPIVVTGLTAGHRYVCRVRARSKAGPSVWSRPTTVRARP